MQSFPLHLILYVVLTVINQGIALRTRFVPSMSMSTKPITIYGSQGSRSPLINWYCHELDLPFQMEPPNATPHPFGQIPCVQDGNSVLFESGAILMYLADKYGELSTPEQRGMVGSWIVWANASLDPVLFKENEKGQVIGTGCGVENKKLRKLNSHLDDLLYILGENFSVADVAIASYLLYIPQFFGNQIDFGKLYPNIAQYMKRCASRDAYRKAYEKEVDGILAICEGYSTSSSSNGDETQKKLFGVF